MEHRRIRVEFFSLQDIEDPLYQYAVIASRYCGRWIFCMHKDRQTWEIPGGHREHGEAILDTARRELFEETGAASYSLSPICAYAVCQGRNSCHGLLCFAEIERLESLPHSEIRRIDLFDALPAALTYPHIQPPLFHRVCAYLG